MEVVMLEKSKDKNKASFILKNANPSYANALRRCIMGRVPVMAIEEIEFKKNSSVLYDEVIAHRLGLVPLKTDLSSYRLPAADTALEDLPADQQLKLTLKTKGPGIVYASDLKSKDPKVGPVYPKTPIVKLLKDQELQLTATAILGKGEDHAKWSPGFVWYSYQPIVTVNNDSDKFEDFKDKFPPQVFGKDGKIDKNLIVDLNLVDACDGVCEDIIKIEYSKDTFIFHIDSWGQLPYQEIVEQAVMAFNDSLNDLTDQLK